MGKEHTSPHVTNVQQKRLNCVETTVLGLKYKTGKIAKNMGESLVRPAGFEPTTF